MSATPSPVEAAAALLGAGEPAAAAALLRPYAEETPGYAGALVVYARALELSGDPLGALRAWHRAYFFAPDSPLVRRERERLLRTSTQHDDSVEAPVAAPVPGPAPAEPETPQPDVQGMHGATPDLDALIEQLEKAPRIRPDSPFEDVGAPEAAGDAPVVSETMASILAAQGQHGEAARLYDALAEQRPADADRFRETARALRNRASA